MKRIFTINTLSLFLSFLICVLLAACGGGGGNSSSSSSSSSGSTSSGPSGGSSGTSNTTRTGSNVVPVSIDGTVFNFANEPFVTLTVCSTTAPSSCISIDHILVDTGSVGLRIFSQPTGTAALSTLGLTHVMNSVNQVGECLQFVQGNTWGPVMLANLTIGGKSANNIALQVINNANDTSFSSAPSACTGAGALMDTPNSFGANGVLGIGLYLQDCGILCAAPGMGIYFGCTPNSNTCTDIGMPVASQVQNPVSTFSTDNNGVILSFNTVSSLGAVSASGTLTFGIDTQANNASTNLNTIPVDTHGNFKTVFEGQTYTGSYIDSGSNGLFFNAPSSNSIQQCSGSTGFYCPPSDLNLTAQISNQSGSITPATVTFNVGNADGLNKTYYVFNNLSGTATDISTQVKTFDWGLPFFLGRDVYVAIEGNKTAKGTGPYFGF